MTDNEIIKALEYCINNNGICEDCPLLNKMNSSKECTDEMIRGALTIINRQKAEIEELATRNSKLKNRFTIEFDHDELKKIAQKAVDGIVINIKQAKSEAIREFAERLKKSAFDVDVSFGYGKECYDKAVAVIEIDNTVKEMECGDND